LISGVNNDVKCLVKKISEQDLHGALGWQLYRKNREDDKDPGGGRSGRFHDDAAAGNRDAGSARFYPQNTL
jgi:hypothetical protein